MNGERPINNLSALVFTAWARVPDSLDCALPDEIRHVRHMFFHKLKGKDEVLAQLKEQPTQPDVVIGWGMGGRLATHAVAQGILRPRLLVLIAVPHSSVERLYDAFKASPDRFRAKYLEKMLEGDDNREEMRVRFWLQADEAHDDEWLHWIGTRFDCNDLDFSSMPHTLVIHGRNDVVVPVEAAEFFRQRIRHARVEILPGCGHAPHMHAPKKIAMMIREELAACGMVQEALERANP